MKKTIIWLITVFCALPALASTAAPDCEILAEKTAKENGIPFGIMAAIARVEAGYTWPDGQHKAWPWTANRAGNGAYFGTKDEMIDIVENAILQGEDNIDLGCMQLNLRWHGDHFATLDDMTDPQQNIQYAASFLLELRDIHGSWQGAIQHYHSNDTDRGQDYFDKVNAVYSQIQKGTGTNPSPAPTQSVTAPVAGQKSAVQMNAQSRDFADHYASHIIPRGVPKLP